MADLVFLSATNGVDRRYQYNITGITQSNPCQLTLSTNNLTVGDQIYISNTVNGMSQIRNKFVTIIADQGTHYDIDLDTTTGYSAYTSGGYVSTYTRKITSVENAVNPKIECKGHDLQVDDYVSFTRMEGMTEINEKVYRVTSVSANDFYINADTTSFGAFTGGNLWNVYKGTYYLNYDALENVNYSFNYVYHRTPDSVLHTLGVDDVNWTLKTNSITTSSDYSGVVSVGDFVGKPNASGNGALETFWKVTGVTSSSITFIGFYGQQSETVTGLKVVRPVDLVNYNNYSRLINLYGNSTIEGGYDFDTNTFQGETWLSNPVADTNNQAQGIYSFGAGNTVKKLNIVNCYHNEFRGTVNIAENCTFQGYSSSAYNPVGLTKYDNCCFMSPTYFNSPAISIASDLEFISPCHIYCYHNASSEAIVMSTATSYKTFNFNQSAVYGARTALQNYVDVNIENIIFYDCDYGINGSYRNCSYIGCEFYRCTEGMRLTGTTASGIYMKDCYFDSCDSGIWNQLSGLRIEDCTFANCNYDLYHRGSGGSVTLVNNNHITPATNAVYVYPYSGVVDVIGDKIDTASLAKAFSYSSTATNLVSPQLRLQDAFGYTGQIFSSYQVLKNEDTTPISLQTKFSTLTQQNLLDFKVASTYTKQSIGKLLKIKIQAVSPGWAGELIPKIKLNEKTIFTGDAITSIPDDSETQLEYSIAGGLITKDGELSINFQANCNNVSVNLFSFEVTDV